MSVSRFSHTDLRLFARMNRHQLADFMRGKGIDAALQTRRELQVALAAYARDASGKKDMWTQEKILVMCQKIEKWCRSAFLKQKLGFDPLEIRNDKNLQEQTRAQVRFWKDQWENLVKGASY